MADISRITLPNGNTYDIKDSTARAAIEAFAGGNAVVFMGVSSSALSDLGNENPTVDSTVITDKVAGQLYFYGTQEYVYGKDNKWHELGSLDSLGTLATKNTVKYDKATSASYTNTGSTQTVSITGTTSAVTISATDNTNGNYQPKGSITGQANAFTGTEKTATVTGNLKFTGDGVRLVTGNISVPKSATLTSTAVTASATYTPAGGVSLSTTSTAPTITGTVSTSSTGNTFQIKGSNAAPTISVKTAGTTDTIQPASSTTVAKTVVAAAPGATAPSNSITYYSVTDETLSLYQLGYTTGASISLGTAKTFKTGDAAYQATAPTFTGQYVKLTNGAFNLPTGASFSGTEATISSSGTVTNGAVTLTNENKTATVSPASSGSATYTPSGTLSQPTTADNKTLAASFSGDYTPEGSISGLGFSGTKVQFSGSATASGSITLPTISLGYTETAASVS